MQDERSADMEVDKVSSHPCHRLSIPSARLFWCRHCMQMFEDPISRWRHSRTCKTDGPVNHSRRKEKEAHAYQLYIESSNSPNPEPAPLPPPVVLTSKPSAMSSSAGSSGGSGVGQPSDLSCFICKKEFQSLEEMKAHVRDPCNKTRETSDFPFEIPEHLKPVEPSPLHSQPKRQREPSRFSTISRRSSSSGHAMVESVRVYPRAPLVPPSPVSVPRAAAGSVVSRETPAPSTAAKELSLTELLSQLADGGGEVEAEEETLEDRLAKEAEQLLSLPQTPGARVDVSADGGTKGKDVADEEDDFDDIFPFLPTRTRPSHTVNKLLEDKIVVPEPAANVEIDQEDVLLAEELLPVEKSPADENTPESRSDGHSGLNQVQEVIKDDPSLSTEQGVETTEQQKPLLKPINQKRNRRNPKTDGEKENNSKPVETKRKRNSTENDPVLRVKRTRKATQKAEALQEEKKMRRRGNRRVRKLHPVEESKGKDSSGVSDVDSSVNDSNAGRMGAANETDVVVSSQGNLHEEKTSAGSVERELAVAPEPVDQDCSVKLEPSDKSSVLEPTHPKTVAPSDDVAQNDNGSESEKSPELQCKASEDTSTGACSTEVKEEPAPESDLKTVRKAKTAKPVKCKICDRTFKSAQLLQRHTRFPCKIKHTRNYTQKMLRPKRALPVKPLPKPLKRKVSRVPKKIFKLWPFELKFDIQLPVAKSNRKSKKRKRKRALSVEEEVPHPEKKIKLPDKELVVSGLSMQEQFLYEMSLVKLSHLSSESQANLQVQLTNRNVVAPLEPLTVKVEGGASWTGLALEEEDANATCTPSLDALIDHSADAIVSPPILEKIDLSVEVGDDLNVLPCCDPGDLEPPVLEPAVLSAVATAGSGSEDALMPSPAAASATDDVLSQEGSAACGKEDSQRSVVLEASNTFPVSAQSADSEGGNTFCPSSEAQVFLPAGEVPSEEGRASVPSAMDDWSPCASRSQSHTVFLSDQEMNKEGNEEGELTEHPPSSNELQCLSEAARKESSASLDAGAWHPIEKKEDEFSSKTVPDEKETRSEDVMSLSSNQGEHNACGASTLEEKMPAIVCITEPCEEVTIKVSDDSESVSQGLSGASMDEVHTASAPTDGLQDKQVASEAVPLRRVLTTEDVGRTSENDLDDKDVEASSAMPDGAVDLAAGQSASEAGEGAAAVGAEVLKPAFQTSESLCKTEESSEQHDSAVSDNGSSSDARSWRMLVQEKSETVGVQLSVQCDGYDAVSHPPEPKSPKKGSANRHFLDLFVAPSQGPESVQSSTSQQQPQSPSPGTAGALSISIPQPAGDSSLPSTPSPSKDVRLSPGGSPIGKLNLKQALKSLGSVLKKDLSPRGKSLDFEQVKRDGILSPVKETGSRDESFGNKTESHRGGLRSDTSFSGWDTSLEPLVLGEKCSVSCSTSVDASFSDCDVKMRTDTSHSGKLLTDRRGASDVNAPAEKEDEAAAHDRHGTRARKPGGPSDSGSRVKTEKDAKHKSQRVVDSDRRRDGRTSNGRSRQHSLAQVNGAKMDEGKPNMTSCRDRSQEPDQAKSGARRSRLSEKPHRSLRLGQNHADKLTKLPQNGSRGSVGNATLDCHVAENRSVEPSQADEKCNGQDERKNSRSSSLSSKQSGSSVENRGNLPISSLDPKKQPRSMHAVDLHHSNVRNKSKHHPSSRRSEKSVARECGKDDRGHSSKDRSTERSKRRRSQYEGCERNGSPCGEMHAAKRIKYDKDDSSSQKGASVRLSKKKPKATLKKDGHAVPKLLGKGNTVLLDTMKDRKTLPSKSRLEGIHPSSKCVGEPKLSTHLACRPLKPSSKNRQNALGQQRRTEPSPQRLEKKAVGKHSGKVRKQRHSESVATTVNLRNIDADQEVPEETRNLFESFQPEAAEGSTSDKKEIELGSSASKKCGVLKPPSGKSKHHGQKKHVSFAKEPIIYDIPWRDGRSSKRTSACGSSVSPKRSKSRFPDTPCTGSPEVHPGSVNVSEVGTDPSGSFVISDISSSSCSNASQSHTEILSLLSSLSPLKSLLRNMHKAQADETCERNANASPASPTQGVENESVNGQSFAPQEKTGEKDSDKTNGVADCQDEEICSDPPGARQNTQFQNSGSGDQAAGKRNDTKFQVNQETRRLQETSKWNQLIASISEASKLTGSSSKEANTQKSESLVQQLSSSPSNSIDAILPSLISALVKNSPQKNAKDICLELYKLCQDLKAKKRFQLSQTSAQTQKDQTPQTLSSVSPSADELPRDAQDETIGWESPSTSQEIPHFEGDVVEEGIVCDLEVMDVDLSLESSLENSILETEVCQLVEEEVVTQDDLEAVAADAPVVIEMVEHPEDSCPPEGVAFVIVEEGHVENSGASSPGLVTEINEGSVPSAVSQDCLCAMDQEVALVE